MSSLDEVFSYCRQQNRAALICYLPAGYPTLEAGIAAARAAIEAGADVVEIGVPYSDPLMDGPVIEQAVQASLAAGTTWAQVFHTVQALLTVASAQPRPVAIVLMSYWNLIEQFGEQNLAQHLAELGAAGVITADLIPEEARSWIAACDQTGISHIFLVAPSSSTQRLAFTAQACSGFVYAASTMGVTGTREQLGPTAANLVQRTRAVASNPDLPICVGLGVSTPEQAGLVAKFADGVIVGSALVKLLAAAMPADEKACAREEQQSAALEKSTAQLRDLVAEMAASIAAVSG